MVDRRQKVAAEPVAELPAEPPAEPVEASAVAAAAVVAAAAETVVVAVVAAAVVVEAAAVVAAAAAAAAAVERAPERPAGSPGLRTADPGGGRGQQSAPGKPAAVGRAGSGGCPGVAAATGRWRPDLGEPAGEGHVGRPVRDQALGHLAPPRRHARHQRRAAVRPPLAPHRVRVGVVAAQGQLAPHVGVSVVRDHIFPVLLPHVAAQEGAEDQHGELLRRPVYALQPGRLIPSVKGRAPGWRWSAHCLLRGF
ncbi:hypothetical protein PG984_009588 [Apiospora sp. TS-2023a]